MTTTKLQNQINNLTIKLLQVESRLVTNPSMANRVLLVVLNKKFEETIRLYANTLEANKTTKVQTFRVITMVDNKFSVN